MIKLKLSHLLCNHCNQNIANHVCQLFEKVISDQGYSEFEQIEEDIQDTEDSEIIQFIQQKLDNKELQKLDQITKCIEMSITDCNGCDNI